MQPNDSRNTKILSRSDVIAPTLGKPKNRCGMQPREIMAGDVTRNVLPLHIVVFGMQFKERQGYHSIKVAEVKQK